MTNLLISIGIPETGGIIFTIVGSLLAGAWYLSGRLTRIETKVEGLETRLTNIEGRSTNAFAAGSPISLRPTGLKALEESGFKKWIDGHEEVLISRCGDSMANPYDIQEAAFKLFDQYDFGEFDSTLKEAAFKNGWSIETMRRVGAIYFRDLCLAKRGFKPEDLDQAT